MKTTTGYTIVYAKIDIDMQNGPVDPATLDQTQRDAQWQLMTNTHPSSSDASTNVSMDAWVINVDTAGTPTFSDDTYSISGGGQYVDVSSGSGSLLQLGMAAVTMGAGCADNPVEGLAVLNELESSSSNIVDAQALLSFGPACDGDFHVTLGTGNYLKANGDSLPLNLTSP